MTPVKHTYVVREGKEHDGQKAGATFDLTSEEAKPFLDKLVLVQGKAPAPKPAPKPVVTPKVTPPKKGETNKEEATTSVNAKVDSSTSKG